MHAQQTVDCVFCRMTLRRRCRASWVGKTALYSTTCTNTARYLSHVASAAFDIALCSRTCINTARYYSHAASAASDNVKSLIDTALCSTMYQYCQVCHSHAASAVFVDIALCSNHSVVRYCVHAASAAFVDIAVCPTTCTSVTGDCTQAASVQFAPCVRCKFYMPYT